MPNLLEQMITRTPPSPAPVREIARAVQTPNTVPPPVDDATQEEPGFLSQLAESSLTALGIAGNLLDLPDSMIRDTLVWDNPFDQWLDPTSHWETKRSVQGREVLDRNILTGWLFTPNKPTGIAGWKDDPWEGVQDVLGFGAELLLSPLSWWAGAVSKPAHALRAAKAGRAITRTADAAAAGRAGKAAVTAGRVADPAKVAAMAGSDAAAAARAAANPTARRVRQAVDVVARAMDRTGDVLNAMDPGYQLGKHVGGRYGNEIAEVFAKTAGGPVAKAVKAGARGFGKWLNKYDLPDPTNPEYRAAVDSDLALLKTRMPNVVEVTQINALQSLIKKAAAGFGADAHFFSAGKDASVLASGVWLPLPGNRYWLSADAPIGGLFGTMLHEATHLLRAVDPEGFMQMVQNFAELPQVKGMDAAGEIVRAGRNYARELGPAQVLKEGVANLAGEAGRNPEVWKWVANHPAVAPHFRAVAKEVLDKAGKHLTTKQHRAIHDEIMKFLYGTKEQMARGATREGIRTKSAAEQLDSEFIRRLVPKGSYMDRFPDGPPMWKRALDSLDHATRKATKEVIDQADLVARVTRALFSYPVKSKTTWYGQGFAVDATNISSAARTQYMEPLEAVLEVAGRNGWTTDVDLIDHIRYAIETNTYQHLATKYPALEEPVQALHEVVDDLINRAQQSGLRRSMLEDVIDYLTRDLNARVAGKVAGETKGGFKPGISRLAVHAQLVRGWLFRGFWNGTPAVNRLLTEQLTNLQSSMHPMDILKLYGPDKLADAWREASAVDELIDPRMPWRDAKTDEYMVIDSAGKAHRIDPREFHRKYERVDISDDMKAAMRAETFPHPGREAYHEAPIEYTRRQHSRIKGDDAASSLNEVELVSSATVVNRVPDKSGKAYNGPHGLGIDERRQLLRENDVQTRDRFQAIAHWLNDHGLADDVMQEAGLFTNHPLIDLQKRIRNEADDIGVAEALPELLSRLLDEGQLMPRHAARGVNREAPTVREMFESGMLQSIDPWVVLDNMRDGIGTFRGSDRVRSRAAQASKTNPNEWKDWLLDLTVPKELWTDITEIDAVTKMLPKGAAGLAKFVRSYTNLFKSFVLTAPARYTRDLISGMVQNSINGTFSFEAGLASLDVIRGRPSEYLASLDEVKRMAMQRGLIKRVDDLSKVDDLTPELATHVVRSYYGAAKGHGSHLRRDLNLERSEDLWNEMTNVQELAESLPGTHARMWGHDGALREVWNKSFLRGKTGGVTPKGKQEYSFFKNDVSANPVDIEGVQYYTGEKRRAGQIRRQYTEGFNEFGPAQAGKIVGKNFDDMNRLTGFIAGMRNGNSADAAFRSMTRAQLNYDPNTFGPIEQGVLKKVFPFYSFFSRELVFLKHELLKNPTGRLGKLIRAQHHANASGDSGQYVPEHIRQNFALPWSKSKDEGMTYLTGLGLMHEDPLSTVMKGIGDTSDMFRELIADMNPLIKGVPEWAFQKSAFMSGPTGARDLSSLDPPVGRILTRLGLQDPMPGRDNTQAGPVFGSRGLEFLAQNSPAARIISTIGKITDDRKSKLERLLSVTTGLRFDTVSPTGAASALRDVGNQIARDAGARLFFQYNFDDKLLNYWKERDPEIHKALLATQAERKRQNKQRAAARREIKREQKKKDEIKR